jgi:hypothetical protein
MTKPGGKRALMIGGFRESLVVVNRHPEAQRLTQYVGLVVSRTRRHGRGGDRNLPRPDLAHQALYLQVVINTQTLVSCIFLNRIPL